MSLAMLEPELAVPELTPSPIHTPRVLVIEDDIHCLEGWSIWLRHLGYESSSACDGRSGLLSVELESPDVVLLDLGLPGIDGFSVLERLGGSRTETPVIVVTAMSSVEVDAKARALGAFAVLPKPVELEELAECIERALE